ncbi:hypothetical protein ACRE_003670 [Hapsidospora chrysogenum ATCC 11550]|uniref:Glycosyltransferase-like protein n=1 Tax=Hapsidospora chrysogenum (strain ATCC 11550 / CBS 779.69 / DSM 880 / IAM 14645 / JCM 23072 / IMI 49137) TaxID=857340 RepID=A0A086TH31_HAPC1|nr:hypothetical protein ACRE_003670 [Hapsidospora chrysogenum ATCC 11550]
MSILSSPRRRLMVAWVVVLIALSLFLSFYHDAAWSVARQWNVPFVTDAGLTAYNETGHPEQVRVAILETGGTHDEVTAALVTAFGGQPDIDLTLMLRRQRYNMEEIMNSFELASPISKIISHDDLASVVSNGPRPHVLVSITCELDLESKAAEFRELLATGETYLFCLVHHADRWRESRHTNVVREYIEKDMAEFIALSPHTADFLHSDTDQWWEEKLNYTVNVMPPVFNVNTAEPDPNEISLAMQGDYSESRRNYQHTFEQLGHVIGELRDKEVSDDEKKRKVRLHVIGHGKPPSVPEELKENVVFDQDLSYPDFYGTLSGAFTIIPAFAEYDYYDRKASSTVPAALIAGVPIVANERLLKSYTYMPREAVWLSEEDEDEMDTIKRFIGDAEGFLERSSVVRETRAKLIDENVKNVDEWMARALEKLQNNKDAEAPAEEETEE